MTSPRFAFTARPASFDGYVRRDGTTMVDGAGRPLLLRGVGLGNWLLPEGYMWKFGTGAESPREIEALVARIAGDGYAAEFWTTFRDRFITEADIARIAATGFDHVRLPINARVVQDDQGNPVEAGYALIDRLIAWCRRHRLWVLLDLHGAPGGQTGTNIDDSPNRQPELFMDRRYRDLTLRLWRDLATRYRDETAVLGYDLLNEPLPNHWQHRYADELVALYRDLTAAIRAVDPDHLLQYEGSHWATNFTGFDAVWDENSVIQFHKYWSPPDRVSITPYLELRDRLGLPLYMGEGGENNLDWLYAAFRLYESEQIGWNFWPWKKLDTRTSPVSVIPPRGWDRIVAAAGGDPAPSPSEARRILDDLLEAVALDNARWQPEIIAALTAQQPASIPAWGFSYAGGSDVEPGLQELAGFRADQPVRIGYAFDGRRADNPFEHNAGRPYSREELLVTRLSAGQWLDFSLDPTTRTDTAVGLDEHGRPAPVEVTPTADGIRVVAAAPTTLARIRLGGPDD